MEIGGLDVSITNSTIWMVIAVSAVTLFVIVSMQGRALVPGRWQSMAELSYEFIAGLVRENVGSEGRAFFPFIFTLFMFILFANTLGLIPYSFTPTSHVAVTFTLAIVVFIGVTVIGFIRHGFRFFGLFLPKGIPIMLAPLLVVIELISYLARPVTLSLRLFANMMAGHTLLKVFGMFVVKLGLLGFAPLVFIVALYGLELIVVFLQAYVFTVLTCLYLNDAIHMHH